MVEPSEKLSRHFSAHSKEERGLHHHDEGVRRWCRNAWPDCWASVEFLCAPSLVRGRIALPPPLVFAVKSEQNDCLYLSDVDLPCFYLEININLFSLILAERQLDPPVLEKLKRQKTWPKLLQNSVLSSTALKD